MDRTELRLKDQGRRSWRRGLGTGIAAVTLLGSGCTAMPPASPSPATVRAAAGEGSQLQGSAVGRSAPTPPSKITVALLPPAEPIPTPPRPLQVPPAPSASPAEASKALPISLDTVLRLAQEQNTQVALAREKVREAYAEKDVAGTRWLPDWYVGTAYYRHEGGIQNEDGTLLHSSFGALFPGMEIDGQLDLKEFAYQQVNAKRKVLQQKGELSRVTSEQLLNAADAYIDLLTALNAVAIARETEAKLQDLLQLAEPLIKVEPGTEGQVQSVKAELDSRRQTALKMLDNAATAAHQLTYFLGLDPCSELVPVDGQLVPFELIDPRAATCDLVAQALATGPGIRELEDLLSLIQESNERAKGPAKYLPTFGLRMAEGGFGAGPGDQLSWDNRWDMVLQARWDLTGFASLNARRRVTAARIQQVHLNYQDLRGKLTAEVQAAHDSIHSGLEQFPTIHDEIAHAQNAYDRTRKRYKDLPPAEKSATEVLNTIRSLAGARLNYLAALRDYDKAQLQLLVLLGPDGGPCPTHAGSAQLPNPPQQGQ
jgi:outer membrane protein TolC